jgi:hypothetical protein
MIDCMELCPDEDLEGGISIVLTIHAGRTPEQAELLYGSIREKAVSLIYGDWIFIPELSILSSSNDGFRHLLETDLSVLDYIREWRSIFRSSGPPRISAGALPGILSGWGELGLVSPESSRRILTRCLSSGADSFDICPGLCLKHMWTGAIANDLEEESAFANCVRERIREALDALGAEAS